MKTERIPKIIHYCWFGKNPFPPLVKKCISSWKRFCPGWDIREWSENNFDINICKYVKEAYEAKKWAFVSDYVRLWALVKYGGIYLDTDCELVKPINEFLNHEAVSGFESVAHIPTALMGCKKGFPLFNELLERYHKRHFVLPDGSFELMTNVQEITKVCAERGFIPNGEKQVIEGFTLYPKEYFCPKIHGSQSTQYFTENTHAIHHYNLSWLSENKIYIYGCGKYGQIWLNSYQALGSSAYVMGFIDSDTSKHGTEICGLPVYPTEKLAEFEFDNIIVANENIAQANDMMATLRNIDNSIYEKATRFSAIEREKLLGYFRKGERNL